MTVDEIRAYCLAFPAATENLQWEDSLCFKIRGKIFAIMSLDNPRLCFKCTPDAFAELIERKEIRPAPYVGRYKWVMLDQLNALRSQELEDLIQQSYEMVAAKAPKSKIIKPKRKKMARAASKHTMRKRRSPRRGADGRLMHAIYYPRDETASK